jgi:hypothetical protein
MMTPERRRGSTAESRGEYGPGQRILETGILDSDDVSARGIWLIDRGRGGIEVHVQVAESTGTTQFDIWKLPRKMPPDGMRQSAMEREVRALRPEMQRYPEAVAASPSTSVNLVLPEILLVIVSPEGGIATESAQLQHLGLCIGRESVDVDVDPPVGLGWNPRGD